MTLFVVWCRCHVPECEGNDTWGVAAAEAWQPAWASWALPEEARCERWAAAGGGGCAQDAFDNSSAVACERYVYQHGSSIVAEVTHSHSLPTKDRRSSDPDPKIDIL